MQLNYDLDHALISYQKIPNFSSYAIVRDLTPTEQWAEPRIVGIGDTGERVAAEVKCRRKGGLRKRVD